MYKRLPYLVAILLCIAFTSPPNRGQQARDLKRPSVHSGLPVVGEVDAEAHETAQEQARRHIREDRYGDHLPKPLTDPGPTVNGQAESTNLTFIDYVTLGSSPDPVGIPASVSTAIVIGTVVSGKCFINKNHTLVYTDYQIKIDQILKPDATANLAVGDSVTASRPGGAIRFRSGHVINVFNVGHGLPEIGAQYVLFLWKAIPNLPEYEIVFDSGYQLANGLAYALDDANSQFNSMDANVLIAKIQKAISGAKP